MQYPLDPPFSALSDPDAFEIIRLWAAHGEQHVTLKGGLWEDPAAWGIVLADLARHAAKVLERDEGLKIEDSLRRIQAGFLAELEDPTTNITSHVRN